MNIPDLMNKKSSRDFAICCILNVNFTKHCMITYNHMKINTLLRKFARTMFDGVSLFLNISSKRLCVQLQLHFKWGIFKTWNDSTQEDSHIVTTAWSDHLWRIFVNLCVHWIGIPQNFACLLAYIGMTKELFPFLYFIEMILRKTTAFLNWNFQKYACFLKHISRLQIITAVWLYNFARNYFLFWQRIKQTKSGN